MDAKRAPPGPLAIPWVRRGSRGPRGANAFRATHKAAHIIATHFQVGPCGALGVRHPVAWSPGEGEVSEATPVAFYRNNNPYSAAAYPDEHRAWLEGADARESELHALRDELSAQRKSSKESLDRANEQSDFYMKIIIGGFVIGGLMAGFLVPR